MPQLADAGAAPAPAVFPKGVLARAPGRASKANAPGRGARCARQGKTGLGLRGVRLPRGAQARCAPSTAWGRQAAPRGGWGQLVLV
jgi:hypothetical protein